MGQEFVGSEIATGCRFAVIVSRFNAKVTEGLLDGAKRVLAEAAVRDEDVTVIHVPGAFELPLTARRAAKTGRFDAVICLGCLIKGETMHFEYLAAATSTGIMDAARSVDVPMTFGVLTALTEGQAQARANADGDNKGREAALAAVEMATLFRRLGGSA